MVYYFVSERRVESFNESVNQVMQFLVTVNVEVGSAALHIHARKHARQSQEMVAVDMADEYVVYAEHVYFEASHVYLRAFTAIY